VPFFIVQAARHLHEVLLYDPREVWYILAEDFSEYEISRETVREWLKYRVRLEG